jgi:methylglyoxal synthase
MMDSQQRIALVAHDQRKQDLLEWVLFDSRYDPELKDYGALIS